MSTRQKHWEDIYATRAPESLSWYRSSADVSLAMIKACALGRDTAIIDIGGGTSVLAEQLLELGFCQVTVLDIAQSALAIDKARLGCRAQQVDWIAADVLSWTPPLIYGLWHDRAAFHFLVDAQERSAYRTVLERGLAPGGWLIMAAFAEDGPERCSGLPVRRWSPSALTAEMGSGFDLVESRHEAHRTPAGAPQNFMWCRFQRI